VTGRPGIHNCIAELLVALRRDLAQALGVSRLIKAKGMLNAMIRAQEFLSGDDRLAAIVTGPEHGNEWLTAYLLRRHSLVCPHDE